MEMKQIEVLMIDGSQDQQHKYMFCFPWRRLFRTRMPSWKIHSSWCVRLVQYAKEMFFVI